MYGFETASHTRFFCDSFSCTFIALRFYRGFSQSFEFTFTVWTPSPFAANRECFRSNARRLPDLPTCGVRSPLLPRGGTHQMFAVKPKLGSDRHFCLFHGTFTLSSLTARLRSALLRLNCQRRDCISCVVPCGMALFTRRGSSFFETCRSSAVVKAPHYYAVQFCM